MRASPLYNLIRFLEYGTKLHIRILFFQNYGNELCQLPRKHELHYSPVCNTFKSKSKHSFSRCVRCSTYAVQKVLKTKQPLSGVCINGIYEYTHPILINNEVACILFIGNIYRNPESPAEAKKPLASNSRLRKTLEIDFSREQCESLCRLLEDYILHLLDEGIKQTISSHSAIHNIQDYISANLSFDVTINRVAQLFHYNAGYLGRLFKRETGVSFNHYIMTSRIEMAKRLLKDTPNSCIEIATEVGFNNVTYFNALFKQQTGVSPTQYRKMHQK